MADAAIVLLVCLFVATFIIVVVRLERMRFNRAMLRFEEKFPPITDEEFVARCTPGTSPDVALRVRRIIAEVTGVPYETIHPSMNFIGDLE